jgi:hypothetical protein
MTHRLAARQAVFTLLALLAWLSAASQATADPANDTPTDEAAAASSADADVSPAPAPSEDADTASAEGPKDDTKYDLLYKFRPGNILRYSVEHNASIRSTIDEITQAAQTKTESVKLWKVTDVLPLGDIEFMNVVERVHMVNQLPDRDPVEYDSEKDKQAPAGFEDAAKAVGVPLSVVRITPRGKVVRRDVKFRQQSAEDDGAVILRLPEQPVAVGDTWDEPLEIKIDLKDAGSKSIQTRRHHKLSSVTNGIATIEVTYQVLSPIDARIESQLVQRLMSGEVRFDIEAGRVVSQRMDVDKRILGFAGPTSSMQYVMRMEEKLEAPPKVAEKPPAKPTPTAASTRPSNRSPRSANRNATPQGGRGYRR